MRKTNTDIFEFEGAKALNGTIKNTALSSAVGKEGGPAALITSDAHGLTVTYSKQPLIYVQSIADVAYDIRHSPDLYNGLRRLWAVTTNNFTILLKRPFVALTPAGTELWFVGTSYDEPWELLGFDLHLNAASATTENLILAKDAKAGAAFDAKLYSKDMNTVQDIVYRFDPVVQMNAGDVAKMTWANSNTKVWGVKLYARRSA